MARDADSNEYFGLIYTPTGELSPQGRRRTAQQEQMKKAPKTSKTIGPHAAKAQTSNATNRARKTRSENGGY